MNAQSQASSQPVNHTDVLIVGAGILGLATAYLAHKQGHSVRVVDASQSPVGSSIQNFGHACFTGQADAVQSMAMASRRLWRQAAQDANFWIAETGTYVPALTETEMQVLKEFHAHRGSEQVRLLSAEEIAEAIGNPQLADKTVGGAHLPLDCRVNPREAAPALANWLGEQGVVFNWGNHREERCRWQCGDQSWFVHWRPRVRLPELPIGGAVSEHRGTPRIAGVLACDGLD